MYAERKVPSVKDTGKPVSALAFIDAIIADMQQQFETRGSSPKFDQQIAFISTLRLQLEKNIVASHDADFSHELEELRRLNVVQTSCKPSVSMPTSEARQLLSLFR
jgi:hypothetical protein